MRNKLILILAIGLLTLWMFIEAPLGIDAQSAPEPIAQSVELLGQIGGVSRAISVQGDTAYLGVGPRIVILNVADPTQPLHIGQTPILPYIVNDVWAKGNYIYVAAGKGIPRSSGYDVGDGNGGLYIFDVSNPATPVEVGKYSTTNPVFSVMVVGNFAYTANGQGGLRLIDIHDPTLPAEISFQNIGGSAQNAAVDGSIAYVADDQFLRLVDVSNPASPVELGSIPSLAWSVEIVGHFAFVTGGGGGLQIIDVTNPETPIKIVDYGRWQDPSLGVIVKENIAYVIGEDGRLRLFDVSDPGSPTDLGKYEMVGSAEDITIVEKIVYIADGGGGLRLIDVSDPTAPVEVGFFDTLGSAEEIAVNGNIVYITDGGSFPGFVAGGGGIRLIDISDPVAVAEIGYFDTSHMARDIEVVEDIAYVADWGVDLRLVDVSDPANPTQLGSFDNVVHLANDLAVVGNVVYIAGGGGLRLVDVSNPQSPSEMDFVSPSHGEPYTISFANDTAYLIDTLGLHLIDITNPAEIKEYGFYQTTYLGHVAAHENIVYVFEDYGDLHVIDITDPTTPVEISSIETSSYSHLNDVALVGNTAYIADGRDGLRIISLADQVVTEVAYFETMDFASSVAVVDNLIFVADEQGGLIILRQIGDNNDVPKDNLSITPSAEISTSDISPTGTTEAQLVDESSEISALIKDLESENETISSPADTNTASQVANWMPLALVGLVGVLTVGGILVWRRWSTISAEPSSSNTCPHCGISNPSHGRFCKRCGRQLNETSR
ncbi:MAG: hypothetical protein IPM53_25570 [Anaerolineaceae bacterium]|nr:hypothetical protein [Anaerolineaceae bacterium]